MLASKGGNIMTALKSFADRYVERFISRKFLAWLTATGLAVGGSLTSSGSTGKNNLKCIT